VASIEENKIGKIRGTYQEKRSGKTYRIARQRRLKRWKDSKDFFVVPKGYVHNIVNLSAPINSRIFKSRQRKFKKSQCYSI